MATVNTLVPIQAIHGKLHYQDNGYFYTDQSGKQRFRRRVENYQKNQSPRQKWNSAAFAYAHRQLAIITSTPDGLNTINQEFNDAGRLNTTATKKYSTASRWKFANLQQSWKNEHPFDQWYAEYTASIQQAVDEKTNAEHISKQMLKQQIELLSEQLITLREQFNNIK